LHDASQAKNKRSYSNKNLYPLLLFKGTPVWSKNSTAPDEMPRRRIPPISKNRSETDFLEMAYAVFDITIPHNFTLSSETGGIIVFARLARW
jgi:hypothetical protein